MNNTVDAVERLHGTRSKEQISGQLTTQDESLAFVGRNEARSPCRNRPRKQPVFGKYFKTAVRRRTTLDGREIYTRLCAGI